MLLLLLIIGAQYQNVILNGVVKEKVYMGQPPGFVVQQEATKLLNTSTRFYFPLNNFQMNIYECTAKSAK